MNIEAINHPIFLCNLDAGIAAIAKRIEGRNKNESSPYFSSGSVAVQISRILAYAKSTPQFRELDFSLILKLLFNPKNGRKQGLHGDLETLAALTLDPGHVAIPRTEEDDVAIRQLIAAIHVACFGSLPFLLPNRGIFGCDDCRNGNFTGEIAFANRDGHLLPGYRVPSKLEKLANYARLDAIWMSREESLMRLIVEASKQLAAHRTEPGTKPRARYAFDSVSQVCSA